MSLELFLKDLIRQAVREELADAGVRTSAQAAPEFLTLAEAAARASTSKGTVRNWVKAGKLRTYGTGRVVRVRRAELDSLLLAGAAGEDQPKVAAQAEAIMLKLAGRG